MTMNPLRRSHEATALEAELKALLIQLYEDTMREQADDINVYGAPHLGSFSLVERGITEDGLTVLRQNDEAAIRYLFKAWRHRNPQRGFHFLRTYLAIIFGDVSNVTQMWQSKDQPYPTGLKSLGEIGFSGETEDDYYLTSRVAVDIDTEVIPDRVVQSLRTTVAARFLLDVRLAKFQMSTLALGGNIGGGLLCFGSGAATMPALETLTDEFFNILTDQDTNTLFGA